MNTPIGDYSEEAKQFLTNLVQQHAHQLAEHVDTVQIFVTKHLEGGKDTRSYEYGVGNFHARFGYVSEWLTVQQEYSREWARGKQRQDLE
jgi:hypothetical protein